MERDGRVPPFVFDLITFIGINGLQEEGVFRIPGNMENLNQWKRRIDTNTAQNLTSGRRFAKGSSTLFVLRLFTYCLQNSW